MAIFNSYVSLPEGNENISLQQKKELDGDPVWVRRPGQCPKYTTVGIDTLLHHIIPAI